MSPRVLLLCSLTFSLLFNVVWSSRNGVHSPADLLSIGAAVACTLIVPAGLHLWPMIPAVGWLARGFRAVLMVGISAAAAVTSFSHSVSVLIGTGWTDWTAGAVTAGIELLVALSTMALRAPVPTEEEQVVEQVAEPVRTVAEQVAEQVQLDDEQVSDTSDEPVRRPVRKPARKLSAVKSDSAQDFLDWAAELDSKPSKYAIRETFKVGNAKATEWLEKLDKVADSEATG